MTRPVPQVGANEKVWLPGETPWAECVAVGDDGTWQGRIINYLFAQDEGLRTSFAEKHFGLGSRLRSLHDYRQNQVVRFGWKDGVWQPAERPGAHA